MTSVLSPMIFKTLCVINTQNTEAGRETAIESGKIEEVDASLVSGMRITGRISGARSPTDAHGRGTRVVWAIETLSTTTDLEIRLRQRWMSMGMIYSTLCSAQ